MDIRKFSFIAASGIASLVVGYVLLISYWNDNFDSTSGGIILLVIIAALILKWYFSSLE